MTDDKKPRILLIADYPGWIFERHARMLQTHLVDEMDIDIAYLGESFDEAAYDLVHPLEWNLVPEGMPRQPFKWVTGIRSHVSWEGRDLPAFCRLLRGKFSRVYAVSARLQAIFRQELPDIVRLPHGVDTEHFRPSAPPPAQGSALRVGWAGNRKAAVKGFEQFIRPLGDLPGVELVFCGYSDRLLGFDEMRAFYDSIDVYVCSSLNEGHNNSLMEAAAMERAIVTTDVGTVPEYLRHEQSALIVPREPGAFRQAIERLQRDPDLLAGLGRAARIAVVDHFQWDARMAEYRKFFQGALALAKPAPGAEVFVVPQDIPRKLVIEMVAAYLEAFTGADPVKLVVTDGGAGDLGKLAEALVAMQGSGAPPFIQVLDGGAGPGFSGASSQVRLLPSTTAARPLPFAARSLAFNQARERVIEQLDDLLARLAAVDAVVERIHALGLSDCIVCGATALGRLAARRLGQKGIEVLAGTDRTASQSLFEGRPILTLEAGLRLAPAAALVTALASGAAIEQEILSLCREQGMAQPEVFRIVLG